MQSPTPTSTVQKTWAHWVLLTSSVPLGYPVVFCLAWGIISLGVEKGALVDMAKQDSAELETKFNKVPNGDQIRALFDLHKNLGIRTLGIIQLCITLFACGVAETGVRISGCHTGCARIYKKSCT
ncbi:unnamed protein product [Amoebophrya sp. A25]|nr:unnamed protein product [Amoebophrya sp. A25]|eukprot:GSA25T00022415001.1